MGISSRKRIVVLGKVVVSGDPDLRCRTSLESVFTLEQQLFENLQFHMTGPLRIVTVKQPRALRPRTTREERTKHNHSRANHFLSGFERQKIYYCRLLGDH